MVVKRIITGKISTNCYILLDQDECAVIDPADDEQRIINELEHIPQNLKYIICTHYHYDHAQGASILKNKKGGEILIHEAEKAYIDFTPDKFLSAGDRVKIGEYNLKVIHTSGHTAGSICLIGDNLIFTGDTLFKDGWGRTDLPGGSDVEMRHSLARLERIIKPGMTVYPGHGDVFTNK